MAAVQEDAQLAAVAPERRAAQLPSARRQELAELVGLSVKAPELFAGLGIKRRHAVVWRRHIEHAVDHERRAFEKARRGLVFLERCFPMLPLPGYLQPLHVPGVDVRQRRVLRAAGIAAVVEPFHLAAVAARAWSRFDGASAKRAPTGADRRS